MNSFETRLCIPTTALPVEYVRLVNSRYPDTPLGPTDTLDDVEVEVDYKPGWFKPGRYYGPPESCYEDEGEYPEILKVVLHDPDYPSTDLLKLLPEAMVESLQTEAWDHQRNTEQDYEPDYDQDPEPYYDE
jgi:hypothetical protein